MSYATALGETAAGRLKQIGSADILIGVPSYNNADTIGHVVATAAEGVAHCFPGMKAIVVNSDGNSGDGTREAALAASLPPGVEAIADCYQGLPGKGSALRAVFEAGQQLGVRACIVLDSDLRSITPDWVERLGRPIIAGEHDYVTPYYVRDKYDGTITNNIVYPMTRMLYGVDVRQPIGGDFAVAGRLLDVYLQPDVWTTDVARFGIDIWMTTTAINEGARVCQAYLGAKIHDARDPAAALGPMFRQVVGTLFGLMQRYEPRWKTVRTIRPAPVLGAIDDVQPEPVSANLEALIARLRQGRGEWGAIWDAVLSDRNRHVLDQIIDLDVAQFHFDAREWADMVLDFAVAYSRSGLDPDQVIDSMVPLYYGRTAGLVVRSRDMDNATFEQQIVQAQASLFESLKPELIARWNS
jgi:hypothetical protein